MEFQNLSPMTLPNYYKMMRVDEFLKQTIALWKTNKETSELLNISPSTINRYKKAIGIVSNRKQVNRTTEEKQAAMLKSMKTKATNKLIKEEMNKIKSLPADQQLSKIEEFKTKYNISSERLNVQAWSISTKGKDKKKKTITELNDQQGKGKNEELYEQLEKGKELNNPMISSDKVQASYSGDTKDLFALLSHNPSPAIKDLLQKKLWTNMVWEWKRIQFVVDDETVARYSNI